MLFYCETIFICILLLYEARYCTVWLILNNSFISFYDVHVFREFSPSYCLPSMFVTSPCWDSLLSTTTANVFAVSGLVVGLRRKYKKFNNNFMTLRQSARSNFFSALIWAKIHWKTFHISFSLSDFSFPFFARYLFTRLFYTTPAKLQIEN